MIHDFWTKSTKYKLFGITIFQTDEIFHDTEYEGEALKVFVKPEYYKAEFEDRENGK